MKLEVGKQYKTRGGWRCVAVTLSQEGVNVWHEQTDATWRHLRNGGFTLKNDHDIIAEWTEPKTGEFWVNVYADGYIMFNSHATKKKADMSAGSDRTACKKVTWTEGDDE
jgi:hypothetical protein